MKLSEAEIAEDRPLSASNRCRDFDEDCRDIECKTRCWLYDPGQGWCPYLTPAGIKALEDSNETE